jgi:hypothetical protein
MVGVHGLPMTDVGAPSARIRTSPARQHLTWLGAGFVVGFAVPFLFADVVQLPRDLYYGDFRSALLARPVAADLVWSVPTLVTLNPIGAPIAHAGLHVTAVLHSYETDVFLPPHR